MMSSPIETPEMCSQGILQMLFFASFFALFITLRGTPLILIGSLISAIDNPFLFVAAFWSMSADNDASIQTIPKKIILCKIIATVRKVRQVTSIIMGLSLFRFFGKF
ncbi:MAG: hypothetical protein ACI92I_000213 [Acidimicrobiales bacterium]|jgi:hypothetical protein